MQLIEAKVFMIYSKTKCKKYYIYDLEYMAYNCLRSNKKYESKDDLSVGDIIFI